MYEKIKMLKFISRCVLAAMCNEKIHSVEDVKNIKNSYLEIIGSLKTYEVEKYNEESAKNWFFEVEDYINDWCMIKEYDILKEEN